MVTTIMNISFIWTPYLWSSKDAPRYVPAMAASSAFSIATALTAWVVKLIMKKKNKTLRNSEDESQNLYVY
jgi:hypothetical protein